MQHYHLIGSELVVLCVKVEHNICRLVILVSCCQIVVEYEPSSEVQLSHVLVGWNYILAFSILGGLEPHVSSIGRQSLDVHVVSVEANAALVSVVFWFCRCALFNSFS